MAASNFPSDDPLLRIKFSRGENGITGTWPVYTIGSTIDESRAAWKLTKFNHHINKLVIMQI